MQYIENVCNIYGFANMNKLVDHSIQMRRRR